jgi:S-layer protein
MPYSTTQLRSMYSNIHSGLTPNPIMVGALDTASVQNGLGIKTDVQTRAMVINTADNDTAVAALSYQFYTGAAPSAAGLSYLVNSSINGTDLNDAYYANFSLENRYINFSTNLGVVGEGAAGFATTYGGLSFSQTVDLAYEKIIGSAYAAAAGVNATSAKADIVSRAGYFTALANQNFSTGTDAQRDLAIKAGVVGYIMGEAMKADIGVYAAAMNNHTLAIINGTALYGRDLLAAYPSTPTTVIPIGGVAPPPVVTDPGPPVANTNLGGGNNTFVGAPGDNIINAGNGDNNITTFGGNDTITTGSGNDTITAGLGNDTINAGDGNNIVDGGDGNNTITTGVGDDTITGGAGNDTIVAGAGVNTITTGAGNDTVTGGAGVDTIIMGANLATLDTITGGASVDILKVSGTLAGVAFTNVTQMETLDLTGASNVTLGAQGMTAGIVTVTNSGNGGVIVDAGAYTTPITITGGTGADTLTGGTGADVLTGGTGVDILNGGTGIDRFVFSDVDADTDVVLTAVTDVISGGFVSGADTLDFTLVGAVGNYQEVLAPVADLAAFSTAADAGLNGTIQYYFGVIGANGYLAFDADGAGITSIIQLTGVTDMAFGDIV